MFVLTTDWRDAIKESLMRKLCFYLYHKAYGVSFMFEMPDENLFKFCSDAWTFPCIKS